MQVSDAVGTLMPKTKEIQLTSEVSEQIDAKNNTDDPARRGSKFYNDEIDIYSSSQLTLVNIDVVHQTTRFHGDMNFFFKVPARYITQDEDPSPLEEPTAADMRLARALKDVLGENDGDSEHEAATYADLLFKRLGTSKTKWSEVDLSWSDSEVRQWSLNCSCPINTHEIFENIQDDPDFERIQLFTPAKDPLKDGGIVWIILHIDEVVINETMDLEHFPIDRQFINLRYTAMRFHNSIKWNWKVTCPDWVDGLFSLRSDIAKYQNPFTISLNQSIITFILETPWVDNNMMCMEDINILRVRLTRKWQHYYTHFVAPCFMIITSSFAALLPDIDEMPDRFSMASTALLTAIAFQWVASDNLPKLSYSTRLDFYILLGLFVVFGIMIEICTEFIISEYVDYELGKEVKKWGTIVLASTWGGATVVFMCIRTPAWDHVSREDLEEQTSCEQCEVSTGVFCEDTRYEKDVHLLYPADSKYWEHFPLQDGQYHPMHCC